jgi:hypothetical protein
MYTKPRLTLNIGFSGWSYEGWKANSRIYGIIQKIYCLHLTNTHSYIYRSDLTTRIRICRKVFATYLRDEGVAPEIIDLLQGRISSSVFVRHYYRPDISKFDEIREKLAKLHGLIVK